MLQRVAKADDIPPLPPKIHPTTQPHPLSSRANWHHRATPPSLPDGLVLVGHRVAPLTSSLLDFCL